MLTYGHSYFFLCGASEYQQNPSKSDCAAPKQPLGTTERRTQKTRRSSSSSSAQKIAYRLD